MDSVTRKVFKLRLWGFRLGPTEMPHPLLTSVTFPLICYDRLKMASIEVKEMLKVDAAHQ